MAATVVDVYPPRVWGGYRVEWKKAEDWDSASVFGVSYTIMRHVFRDLEAGTEYTARVYWTRNVRYPDLRKLLGEATGTTGGVQGVVAAGVARAGDAGQRRLGRHADGGSGQYRLRLRQHRYRSRQLLQFVRPLG